MTIETYTLQFHLAKAENSQDIQNRYLLYNQVQNATLAEEERARALRARQQVQEANEPEGKPGANPDDEGGGRGSSRRKKRQADQDKHQSDGKRTGPGGGGHLIDVTI